MSSSSAEEYGEYSPPSVLSDSELEPAISSAAGRCPDHANGITWVSYQPTNTIRRRAAINFQIRCELCGFKSSLVSPKTTHPYFLCLFTIDNKHDTMKTSTRGENAQRDMSQKQRAPGASQFSIFEGRKDHERQVESEYFFSSVY